MLNFIGGLSRAVVKVVTLPIVLPLTIAADFTDTMNMGNKPSKTGAVFDSIGKDLEDMTK